MFSEFILRASLDPRLCLSPSFLSFSFKKSTISYGLRQIVNGKNTETSVIIWAAKGFWTIR